ncbi:MAG TPA: LamG domain-containing protein, partial [Kofleriaceae bacterium]|nr:LamG domain-containing protein [Kofleriaceae bacterium]
VRLPGAPPGATGPHIAFTTSPLAACSEFTFAVWIKPDAIDSSRIFDFGNDASSYLYLAVTDGTGVHFGMAAPSKPAFDVATTTQPLTIGVWHHVAVTLLSGTANLYVDGALAATKGGTTIKPTDLGATTQNWIGRSRAAGDRYLSGSLDELRVACRAYTADEIVNLSRPQ